MTVIEEHTETWGPQVGRKHNNPSYDTRNALTLPLIRAATGADTAGRP